MVMGVRIFSAALIAALAVSALAAGSDAPNASACRIIGDHRPYVIQPNSDCSNIVRYYLPLDTADSEGTQISGNLSPALQTAEPKEDNKDVPWIPILILALIIPTAALLIPSFLAKRNSGEDTGPAG